MRAVFFCNNQGIHVNVALVVWLVYYPMSHSTPMTGRINKNIVPFPLSGDALTDWLFRQFVFVLRSQHVLIARKKYLMNPDDHTRRAIRGLMDPEIHPSGAWVQILINPAKNTHRCRNEEVETLVHELAHVLLPKTPERAIVSIENILARRLTTAQRRYLKSFLPRHEVKRYPKLILPGRIAVA